jgi:hypothetical protein
MFIRTEIELSEEKVGCFWKRGLKQPKRTLQHKFYWSVGGLEGRVPPRDQL